MGRDSAIEWTHHTFNPWWGCDKVSPECTNCYAEMFDKRIGGGYWGKDAPRRFFKDAHWLEPVKWNIAARETGVRARVFCASQADVFEERAELAPVRDRLFDLIDATPCLDWLLLTKRADVMRVELARRGRRANVWAGVSVGCNETRWRLVELAQIDAAVRFVSAEPLLELVDFRRVPVHAPSGADRTTCRCNSWTLDALAGVLYCPFCGVYELQPYRAVDWVICGGESGSGRRVRPMPPAWAQSLRDQCAAASVPFLFKQWGQYVDGNQVVNEQLTHVATFSVERMLWRVRNKKDAGRLLDGRTWDEYPTVRT